jgi:hypothetical protein
MFWVEGGEGGGKRLEPRKCKRQMITPPPAKLNYQKELSRGGNPALDLPKPTGFYCGVFHDQGEAVIRKTSRKAALASLEQP